MRSKLQPSLLILVLISLLISSRAQSEIGQLLFDTRMDFQSYSANHAVDKPAYSAFRINRMRLDMQGTLGVETSFRIRLDVLNSNDEPTSRDRTSKFIDFAYVSRSLSDNLKLVVGKYITGMGGIEGANGSGNFYLRSVAGDEVRRVFYPVGAQLEFDKDKNRLRLNIANISEDIKDSNSNLTNTSSLYGFTYTAQFFDGVWSPNLSYHTESFKTATEVSNKKDKSYLAIGSKISISDFDLEIDHLSNKNKIEIMTSDDILNTQSNIALVRYKFLQASSIHFKYETTQQKKALNFIDTENIKINGMTLAYEFKPFKDENWRAHLAGTQKNTKVDGDEIKTEKVLYLGIRMVADLLK